MNWEKAASIATVVEAFVVVSIVFIWIQLRRQTELTKAANNQALVEIWSPFNLQLVQDEELMRLWLKGSQNFKEADALNRRKYQSLLEWYLIFHENIFYQHRKGEWDLYTMYKLCGNWKPILIDFSPELLPAGLSQNQRPQAQHNTGTFLFPSHS
jgi:hypothetical protein